MRQDGHHGMIFATRLETEQSPEPSLLDRGRFWGLAFARSGERVAYVTHDQGFCQMLESDLEGRERRCVVSLGEHEVISEVHGWDARDRHVVYSVTVRGRSEIRVVDLASRIETTVVHECFFGGWDDAHDAFFVWDRQTGSRRVLRVKLEERGGAERRVGSPTGGRMADRGRINSKPVLVDAGHIDRRIARTDDGRTVYYAEKFLAKETDKRFTIYRCDDGAARVPIAMIAATCRTPRLSLTLSPGGRYLHVNAHGILDESGEAASFDLVLATDGSHRRLLPVKGWVAGDRALVPGRGRSLEIVDPRDGVRHPLVRDAVEQFSVARGGNRIAFTSGARLCLAPVPA